LVDTIASFLALQEGRERADGGHGSALHALHRDSNRHLQLTPPSPVLARAHRTEPSLANMVSGSVTVPHVRASGRRTHVSYDAADSQMPRLPLITSTYACLGPAGFAQAPQAAQEV
jgi:hypothetical protein